MARAPQRYIAIIADMVGSRSVARSRRSALQEKFADLMDSLNRDYKKMIASRFVITLGDEFQGLLNAASPIPDLIWRLEQEFSRVEFRVGIGLGRLDTPIQKYAINIDGPALHIARAAVEDAKRNKVLGGTFRGFGDLDDVLNGIARLLWFQRSRWTVSQRTIANFIRRGMSQTQVAKRLRVTKQVVSKQVSASGCYDYMAAEKAWRMILEKQVNPLLGLKHVPSQSH